MKIAIAIAIAAAMALVLTGCASPVRHAWVKEGASTHATESDLSKCNYQIKLQKTPALEQDELRALCMKGEVYRLKRVS